MSELKSKSKCSNPDCPYLSRAVLFSMTEFFKECEKPEFRNELYEKEIVSLKEKIKELDKNLQIQCGYTLSEGERAKQLKAQIVLLRAGLEKFPDLLCNVVQVFDGWHNDGTIWSEWDEQIRKSVGDLQKGVEQALCLTNSGLSFVPTVVGFNPETIAALLDLLF